MRLIAGAILGAWFAFCSAAAGQTGATADDGRTDAGRTVLIELYTSQGCSSCPPADEFLSMLSANPSVISLALHVDYWDYIGWADSFAKPEHTKRQKAYARMQGSRTIYTPQFVIGGVDFVEGADPAKVAALVRTHLSGDAPVMLTVKRRGDVLVIRAVADPPLDRMARVQLVRYLPSETVKILHGENAGHTVTYQNIVTSWQVLADWPGQSPLEMEAKVTGSEPVVVIIQNEGPRAVLAAARIE